MSATPPARSPRRSFALDGTPPSSSSPLHPAAGTPPNESSVVCRVCFHHEADYAGVAALSVLGISVPSGCDAILPVSETLAAPVSETWTSADGRPGGEQQTPASLMNTEKLKEKVETASCSVEGGSTAGSHPPEESQVSESHTVDIDDRKAGRACVDSREGEGLSLGSDRLMNLGCACKSDMAVVHYSCALRWFVSRSTTTCEVCNEVATSVRQEDVAMVTAAVQRRRQKLAQAAGFPGVFPGGGESGVVPPGAAGASHQEGVEMQRSEPAVGAAVDQTGQADVESGAGWPERAGEPGGDAVLRQLAVSGRSASRIPLMRDNSFSSRRAESETVPSDSTSPGIGTGSVPVRARESSSQGDTEGAATAANGVGPRGSPELEDEAQKAVFEAVAWFDPLSGEPHLRNGPFLGGHLPQFADYEAIFPMNPRMRRVFEVGSTLLFGGLLTFLLSRAFEAILGSKLSNWGMDYLLAAIVALLIIVWLRMMHRHTNQQRQNHMRRMQLRGPPGIPHVL